jgi:hypothetical protein
VIADKAFAKRAVIWMRIIALRMLLSANRCAKGKLQNFA